MPSAKVQTVAAMNRHVSAMLRVLGGVLYHNVDKKRVRRCHFQSYIQRQAALDALCHRLSGGRGKDAVVVFWAAKCVFDGLGVLPHSPHGAETQVTPAYPTGCS